MDFNFHIVIERARDIRGLARSATSGKWGLAMLGTFVYMLAEMLPMILIEKVGGEHFGALYSAVVAGPFTFGYCLFCLNIFRQKEAKVSDVFAGFGVLLKAFLLTLVMYIFILLWSLLFIIPGIIATYRYSMAFFVMIDNPELGIMDCLAVSKQMMKGNKFKEFCLTLSFIGWIILVLIITSVIGSVGTIFIVGSGGDPRTLVKMVTEGVTIFTMTPLTAYMTIAMAAFYELASGHLVPEPIDIEPIDFEGKKDDEEANLENASASDIADAVIKQAEKQEAAQANAESVVDKEEEKEPDIKDEIFK